MNDMKLNQSFCQIEVKYNDRCQHGHILYYKQHLTKVEAKNKPQDRTLLVCNIPPYMKIDDVKQIFEQFGSTAKIFFEDILTQSSLQLNNVAVTDKTDEDEKFFGSPIKGFKSCFIVFTKEIYMKSALSSQMSSITYSGEPLGINKWCKNYADSWPNEDMLIKNTDDFMMRYDTIIEEQERREMEMEGVPDEDGWIKVTKKGHSAGASRSELAESVLKAKALKKRKAQELLNVYSFQVRETKREQIAKLRKKFQEDKDKIKQMKTNRKFKPF